MRIVRITLSTFMFISLFYAELVISQPKERSSHVSYPDMVTFQSSWSTNAGSVFEVLPGPSVINPAMNPTPFSDKIAMTAGSYSLSVADLDLEDSAASKDSVVSVNILFTGNNGTRYKIGRIKVIHKPANMGDHTFFGGVGLNKVMHGNTGIGTNLMPKMLSYITLWGVVDLKNADTDTVIAANRIVHLMVSARVRNESLRMLAGVETDSSDHNIRKAETHIILPPKDMQGNPSPVPGTDHGFLHMMFEDVKLGEASRDWTRAFEILPGPAVINPAMNPTPFSNRIGIGGGSFSLKIVDVDSVDSPASRDSVSQFNLRFERADGTIFTADAVSVIHKPDNVGDHTFFGGVGIDKLMHGNSGIGTPLMPKLFSYITLWGVTDLKDENGNVIAPKRLIHIMVSSRVRTDSLTLITSTTTDLSDHSEDNVEVHIIFPPKDMAGNFSPVPGTGHGFLHLMFEKATLEPTITSVRREENENATPSKYFLFQNYPNPFNPVTTIKYILPGESHVRLKIYNVFGQEVLTLLDEVQDPGGHSYRFDAKQFSSGIYVYSLETEEFKLLKRMALVK